MENNWTLIYEIHIFELQITIIIVCRSSQWRCFNLSSWKEETWKNSGLNGVRFPFKPEFFQVSSFQPLRLKHLHCDDLHIILSIECCLLLSQVTIYKIECNLQFVRIKLLESKPNNESKQSKGNHTPSNSSDQPVNVQAEESKVLTVKIMLFI